MKIRYALPTAISLLALLLVAVTGYQVYDALKQRAVAEQFVTVNEAASLLLKSTADWAVERGLTNGAMRAAAAADDAAIAAIAAKRESADEAMIERWSGSPPFPKWNWAGRAWRMPRRVSPRCRPCAPRSMRN